MEDKIKAALEIAFSFSQIDGSHHKAWVIDQMVRKLTGENYEKFISDYCEDGNYEWDTGIAP